MSDDRMDIIIGNLLRIGVSAAALVVIAGGVWYLLGTNDLADYSHFHPAVVGLQAFRHLPPSRALILWGLLLLIATPVARVVFSLVAFAMERDRTYVIATLIVLVVLLYSIATAWA